MPYLITEVTQDRAMTKAEPGASFASAWILFFFF